MRIKVLRLIVNAANDEIMYEAAAGADSFKA